MSPSPTYIYRATVTRVVDGDTIRCLLDLGLRTFREESIRVRDVNAPEMNTDAGKAAKQWLSGVLAPGTSVVVATYKDKQSFSRYVADVWWQDNLLADMLVNTGHAVRVNV